MIKNKILLTKVLALIFYLAMVIINALANILPINNIDTGQISDNYANLFAPAGLTFSIWGLIYLLLGFYVIYQFFAGKKANQLIEKISPYFIISSIANISWIFAWHYDFINLSALLIIFMLLCLIKIADLLRKEKLNNKEAFFISWPFSIYFAWITVATIANITIFLVSINWSAWGISDQIWTVIILLIGAIIGIVRMFWDKSIAYGLVFIWAYFGIYLKHISTDGWERQYPLVISTAIMAILAFIISEGILIYKKRQ
jgi:hypothetical protein